MVDLEESIFTAHETTRRRLHTSKPQPAPSMKETWYIYILDTVTMKEKGESSDRP